MAPVCFFLSVHEQGMPLYYLVFPDYFPNIPPAIWSHHCWGTLWLLKWLEFPLRKKAALWYPRGVKKRFHNPEVLNDGPWTFFVHRPSCLYPSTNPYNHFSANSLPRSLSPDITFCWYQNIYLGTDHWHLGYYIYWLISTWIHLWKQLHETYKGL